MPMLMGLAEHVETPPPVETPLPDTSRLVFPPLLAKLTRPLA
jgi:hypothetical protein